MLLLAVGLSACAAPAPAGPKFVVFFGEWSAGIDPDGEASIRAAATAAAKMPDAPVTVTGFADPVGSADANIELSRTRAQVVYDALVHDGVAASRIQQSARGRTDFALSAQESRRVEITVGGP